MGVIKLANVVDHVIGFEDGSDLLATDEANLTPLCKEHHDQITARFDRSSSLDGMTIAEARKIKYIAITHDDNGFPITQDGGGVQ